MALDFTLEQTLGYLRTLQDKAEQEILTPDEERLLDKLITWHNGYKTGFIEGRKTTQVNSAEEE